MLLFLTKKYICFFIFLTLHGNLKKFVAKIKEKMFVFGK